MSHDVASAGVRRPLVGLRIAGTVLFVLLAGQLGLAGTAGAHTDLERSVPAAGSRSQEPPSRVTLVFGESVSPELAAVSLVVDGRPTGRLPVSRGRETNSIVAAVGRSALPDNGSRLSNWRVGYRITAEDGHLVAGSTQFVVRRPGEPPTTPVPSRSPGAPGTSPQSSPLVTGAVPASDQGDGNTVATIVIGGLAALGVALVCIPLSRARQRDAGK